MGSRRYENFCHATLVLGKLGREMKNFEYFEPIDVREALDLLTERKGAVIFGGGTDLIPRMKKGLISPPSLINITLIPSLQEIRQDQGKLKIGAAVPLVLLERNSLLLTHYTALQKACSYVATPAIRNIATLGGNVCLGTKCIFAEQIQTWTRALEPCFKRGGQRCYVVRGGKTCHASLASDTIPALIALGAMGTIASPSGEKTIPVEELFTGDGVHPLSIGYGELLTGLVVPTPPAGGRSTYLRYSLRKAIDFPLVSAGLYLEQEDGVCLNVRVVIGAVAPIPIRLSALEEGLKDKIITPDLLREWSEEAPKEALRRSRSGRIDAFLRNVMAQIVYQGLIEVSE
ncbi:MAG: FAD binding domain-containing protein [Candidatus Jordarchaeaceae archaeon]